MGAVLLIRADAVNGLGSGHILRMLALGQAWQDNGGEVVFVTNVKSTELIARLKREGFVVLSIPDVHPNPIDTQELLRFCAVYQPKAVAIDGYHFDLAYQRTIRSAGYVLLMMEDFNQHSLYEPDLLVVLGVEALQYNLQCAPWTKLLTGPKYALIRREFLRVEQTKKTNQRHNPQILISFGGEDAPNATAQVLQALMHLKWQGAIRVLTGVLNRHTQHLRKLLAPYSQQIQFLDHQNDMAPLLAETDILIGSGGGTCWEACLFGIPMFTLSISDNQIPVLLGLEKNGVLHYCGNIPGIGLHELSQKLLCFLCDDSKLQKMSIKMRNFVDGKGPERIVHEILLRRHL